MSYQPLDDQLSTQFLELLGETPQMQPSATSRPGKRTGAAQEWI